MFTQLADEKSSANIRLAVRKLRWKVKFHNGIKGGRTRPQMQLCQNMQLLLQNAAICASPVHHHNFQIFQFCSHIRQAFYCFIVKAFTSWHHCCCFPLNCLWRWDVELLLVSCSRKLLSCQIYRYFVTTATLSQTPLDNTWNIFLIFQSGNLKKNYDVQSSYAFILLLVDGTSAC